MKFTNAQLHAENEKLAGLLEAAEVRNKSNMDNLLSEQSRFAGVISTLERENRELRKLDGAAQEGRTSLLQDIARLSGMLDMLRELGTIPPKDVVVNNHFMPPEMFARQR